jgi:hypothetical protein
LPVGCPSATSGATSTATDPYRNARRFIVASAAPVAAVEADVVDVQASASVGRSYDGLRPPDSGVSDGFSSPLPVADGCDAETVGGQASGSQAGTEG